MIKLTAQGKFIDTKEIDRLLTQGEKYSDIINIFIPSLNNDVELSDCTFYMRAVSSNGSMTETMLPKILLENEIQLLWNVSEYITAVPGMLSLELIGTKGSECIIKYKMPAVYVKEAVMGEGLPVPDVIEDKLALMNVTLSHASELYNESETLYNETQELQSRIEELAQQIGISSEYVAEVIEARKGYLSSETYTSLSERLEFDLSMCINVDQLFVILGNEIGKVRAEWQSDIQNALGTVETNLSEVVNLSDSNLSQ
ncbi:MAG: hypothetical protein ACI4JN_08900 [Ruminococcus sp.]